MIKEDRECEAIQASFTQLTGMKPVYVIVNAIGKTKTYANRGLIQAKKACPAYNGKCSSCGNMGHCNKFCRKTARDIKQSVYKQRNIVN